MRSGPHCVGLPPRNRITSVGLEFPGVETLLANVDQDGNGEVSVMKSFGVLVGCTNVHVGVMMLMGILLAV